MVGARLGRYWVVMEPLGAGLFSQNSCDYMETSLIPGTSQEEIILNTEENLMEEGRLSRYRDTTCII